MKRKKSLTKIFKKKQPIKAISGFNYHKNFSKRQQGGICIMAFDKICNRFVEDDTDPSGIGRWCWMKLKLIKPTARRLICSNKESTNKYIRKLEQYSLQIKILIKAYQIHKNSNGKLN